MCRVLFLGLVLTALLMVADAQLTFSTDWGNGKRSVRSDTDCVSEEGIYAVYKLIQREAEKFLACQTEGKN